MSTGVLKYCSPTLGLPSHKDTEIGAGIREFATHKANESVKRVLEKQSDQIIAKKRKLYTIFLVTNRAKIGKLHSNMGTVCLQKKDHKFLDPKMPKSHSFLTHKTIALQYLQ